MTSKSAAFSYTSESMGNCRNAPSSCLPAKRSACGHAGCSLALVCASPGGEQRDVMTEAHELFGDVRDDALGATIELRRYAFVQRCNLGDAQTRHRGIVG